MGPDSNGDCSCPAQHRCSVTGVGASSHPPTTFPQTTTTVASTAGRCVDAGPGHAGNQTPDDSCPYSKRGTCYEPQACATGTDCTDCNNCGPPVRAGWHWNPVDCPSCSCVPWCDTTAEPYISCKQLRLTTKLITSIENKAATFVDLSENELTEAGENTPRTDHHESAREH